MAVPLFVMSLLAGATLFFGAVHVWSLSIVQVAVYGAGFAACCAWCRRCMKQPPCTVSFVFDPLSLGGIFFMGWTAFQVAVLPLPVLERLSAETAAMWSSLAIVGVRPEAATVSLYPFVTMTALAYGFAVLVLYWIVRWGVWRRGQVRMLVIGILAMGVGEALWGMAQLLPGEHWILWWNKAALSPGVASGSFINRNHLAGFLAVIICLGLGYAWALARTGSSVSRGDGQGPGGRVMGGLVCILALAVMMAGLLSTASRGGVIALLCGVVFMLIMAVSRSVTSRKSFVVVVVLALVAVYVAYAASARVVERFAYFDRGLEGRLAIARAACAMGRDYPVAGSGLGTFQFVFPRYQTESFAALYDYAHNDWLQLVAETGGVGLGIVLVSTATFLVMLLFQWRRRRDPVSVGLGLGGCGAFVAIAVHALSEFNLHIPAVMLLLAVIAAITGNVLFVRGSAGREYRPQRGVPVPRAVAVLMVALFVGATGAAGTQVIRTWRAEMLAPTAWDSTRALREPTCARLAAARRWAPGNAAYWAWSARICGNGEENGDGRGGSKDRLTALSPAAIYWTEALRRNPSNWSIWRELGWDPTVDDHLAARAITRAAALQPLNPLRHLEAGIVQCARGGDESGWMASFGRALSRDGSLIGTVIDQVDLYKGKDKAVNALETILPDDPVVMVAAGRALMERGYYDAGIRYCMMGEKEKEGRLDELWCEYRDAGGVASGEKQAIIESMKRLDRRHPGVLLDGGSVIAAVSLQDKRTGHLADLDDVRVLAARVRRVSVTVPEEMCEKAYLLGRLAEEAGEYGEAARLFEKAVSLNIQHFPSWIHLTKIPETEVAGSRARVDTGKIARRIAMFAMTGIPPSVWRYGGLTDGEPSWRAAFRIDSDIGGMRLAFSARGQGVWKCLVDGRFVSLWKGGRQEERCRVAVPAGEHELRVVQCHGPVAGDGKKAPFHLTVTFEG